MELFRAFGRLVLEGQEAVERGLMEAEAAGKGFADSLEEVGKGLSAAGDQMTKWVTGPIAGVAAGLSGLAFSAANAGDEIAKGARAAGLSVPAYQEIEFALGRIAGVTENETNRALRDLNRTLSEAQSGSASAQEQLTAMGFSLQDIESGAISTEEAFNAFVRQIEQAGSSAEANTIAMEAFGRRAGIQLSQAIREGGESVQEARKIFSEEVGGLTQEQAELAEEFTDKWDVMTRQLGMFKNEIGLAVMPAIMDLVGTFQENLLPVLERGAERFGQFVEWFTQLSPEVQQTAFAITGLVAVFGPLLSIIGRIIKPIAALIRLVAGLGAAKAALLAIANPVGLAIAAIGATIVAGIAIWRRYGDAISEVFGSLMDMIRNLPSRITNLMGRVTTTLSQWRQSAVDVVAGFIDTVLDFFSDLPGQVLRFVTRMVRGVIDRISGMVSTVTSLLSRLRRAVVGNSIIPDMASDVVKVMDDMTEKSIAAADEMRRGVTDALPDAGLVSGGPEHSRSARAQREVGRGSVNIDMRHSIIRDDRDMMRRAQLHGTNLHGAAI